MTDLPPSRTRRWVRPAMWALSLATIAITVVVLRDRMAAVEDAGGLPGPGPLLVAVALNLAATFVMTDAWRKVVAIGSTEPPWRTSLWVWAASQLSRYTISGAQVAGRAAVATRYGIALLPAGAAAVVEVGWQLAVAATIALALLPAWLPSGPELAWTAWAGVVPALGLLALHVAPTAVMGAAGRTIGAFPWIAGRRIVRTQRIGAAIAGLTLRRSTVTALTGYYIVNTVLRTAGFVVLLAAIAGSVGGRGPSLGLAIGAYLVGQIVGRLAIFAPGGIGPREGATALVLSGAIGGGPALLLVAVVRLVEIVAEVAFVAWASWLSREVRAARVA